MCTEQHVKSELNNLVGGIKKKKGKTVKYSYSPSKSYTRVKVLSYIL